MRHFFGGFSQMNMNANDYDPRRRILIQALGAGLFSVLGIPAFAAEPSATVSPLKGRSIYRLSGSVLVNNLPATQDTRIGPDDVIQTAKNGEVVFVSGTQAFILRGDSHLALNDKPSGAGVANAFRLITGQVLAVFGKGRHRLTTMTATIGIRGTGIYAEADPEQTYFCNCYGKTDVSANSDPESKESIIATHHDRPVYILSGQPAGKNIRLAPFINHTDPELMLVESLVERIPTFVFPSDSYSGPRRIY
jgi:hypothetical protein